MQSLIHLPRPRSARARRRLPGLLVVAGGLLLAVLGCGGEQAEDLGAQQVPTRGGTLRVLIEPPGSLDPVAVDEVYEAAVVRQIYEGLVLLDADFRLLPGLASSWTISPDERSYTFRLRPGIRFHNGQVLSAADVAFSLQRCLDPDDEIDCLARSYLEHIRGSRQFVEGQTGTVEGIQVLGDRTLRIELNEALPNFLYVLAMDQTCVVPRRLVESEGRQTLEVHPIGSGPFRFIRRNVDGGVTLARFGDYWGPKPFLDSLVYQPLPESEGISETEALLLRRVDLATLDMGDSQEARAAGLPVYRSPELSLSFLALRLDQPPLDIAAVRRAILLAVDRGEIQKIDPEGMIPVAGLLPPGMPGRVPESRMPAVDRAEAARLLRDAGYPGGEGLVPIRIGTTDAGRAVQMCEIVRGSLEEIGLQVEIVAMDWRLLDSLAVAGRLPAFLMSWVADLPDATSFLYALFHSQGESNLFAYASPEVDSLLERLRRLPPGPEQIKGYLAVQDAVLRDVPMVPLYHSSLAYAWRPEVRGLKIGPSGLALIDMCQVYIQPAAGLAQRGGMR